MRLMWETGHMKSDKIGANLGLRIMGLIQIYTSLEEGVFSVLDCLNIIVEMPTW